MELLRDAEVGVTGEGSKEEEGEKSECEEVESGSGMERMEEVVEKARVRRPPVVLDGAICVVFVLLFALLCRRFF